METAVLLGDVGRRLPRVTSVDGERATETRATQRPRRRGVLAAVVVMIAAVVALVLLGPNGDDGAQRGDGAARDDGDAAVSPTLPDGSPNPAFGAEVDPDESPNDPNAPAVDPGESPNDPNAPAVDPSMGPNDPSSPAGRELGTAVPVGDWKVTVRGASASGDAVLVRVLVERTGPGPLYLKVRLGGVEHDLGGAACGGGGTLPDVASGASREVELCSTIAGATTAGAVLVAEGPTASNTTPDPLFLALA